MPEFMKSNFLSVDLIFAFSEGLIMYAFSLIRKRQQVICIIFVVDVFGFKAIANKETLATVTDMTLVGLIIYYWVPVRS